MSTQPDIVLLVLDTQRLDRLSCYGHPLPTSPYLDTFAEDATLFRHAFSTAQWTIPSHTSMFTGLYPDRHNMLHASSLLPENFIPLAERLRVEGYFTDAFCNNPLLGVVNTGLQRGFMSFLNYAGLMTSRPNQTGYGQSFFDHYRKSFKRLLATMVTGIQDTFAHSDTLLDLSFSPLMAPLWQTALSFKGNTARSLRDAARLHVERKDVEKNQPIFSFINLMGTHMPYHPPHRIVEQLAPSIHGNRAEQRYLRQFNSDVFGWLAPLTKDMDEQHKATLDGMYNAEVANQDQLVGDFLEKLRASGRLDQTLLIVCADHGEHLGEKQLMGHSISLYNTLVHVPLIIRSPEGDFPRGSTVDHVVSTRRIFHTALSAAGCATPSEQAYSLAQSASSDPDENLNLRDILPEQVELLQTYLQNFTNQLNLNETSAETNEIYSDPQVYRRLHDLGFLGDLAWRAVGTVGGGELYTTENDTGPDDVNHAQYGLFILHDPQHPAHGLLIENAQIYDILPTLLARYGITTPAGLRGKVLNLKAS